ncbi:MAG: hypothetical protein HZA54_09575, partial [Planctomycetes bacterium]|nr:hypothetical protein [Planctomycetota bacterium]
MDPGTEDLLIRLAQECGLLTADQAAAARAAQARETPAPPLGVALVEAGLLNHAQVLKLCMVGGIPDAAAAALLIRPGGGPNAVPRTAGAAAMFRAGPGAEGAGEPAPGEAAPAAALSAAPALSDAPEDAAVVVAASPPSLLAEGMPAA